MLVVPGCAALRDRLLGYFMRAPIAGIATVHCSFWRKSSFNPRHFSVRVPISSVSVPLFIDPTFTNLSR
ncbi:unnamed protein product [Protopolystoma xenopodis]|uniref:Uncharacterized protein n=1 Tax=Protopolystoma xenopodis TaxID=117903 RepID=A0A3S5AEG7_9PLAT|nr:unnamed protein product [Protopolystoma xenopodis]